jgi:hypothetical protein
MNVAQRLNCTVSHDPVWQTRAAMAPTLYSERYAATKTPISATSAMTCRLLTARWPPTYCFAESLGAAAFASANAESTYALN